MHRLNNNSVSKEKIKFKFNNQKLNLRFMKEQEVYDKQKMFIFFKAAFLAQQRQIV